MEKVYIFGHKKPDTDSVAGAISFAYLKRKLGINAEARILSEVNKETIYALNRFGFEVPKYLNDVKVELKDIKYNKNYYANQNDSIFNVYNTFNEHGITGIPLVDDHKKFVGYVSLKELANELIKGDTNEINAKFMDIVDVLNASSYYKFDDFISGNVLAVALPFAQFSDFINIYEDTILICGRDSIIEDAVKHKARLIIVVANKELTKEEIDLIRYNKVNVIVTPYDTFKTSRLITLVNPIKTIKRSSSAVCFGPNDYLTDFVEISNKLKHTNYPIVNSKGYCDGMLRLIDTNLITRKKVILVDHNEPSQSADGLNEADILEIVDHHNIGKISTLLPINFRNMSVGSVNTIIYTLYKENNIEIPSDIAGVMLSGIISDTLLLASPTTTELDKQVAKDLANIAELDLYKYGKELLKSGVSNDGLTINEIVYKDFKSYVTGEVKFGIGQVFTTDFKEYSDRLNEYVDELNHIADNNDYKVACLFVTDILENNSYLLFNDGAKEYLNDAYELSDIKEGEKLMGVISRKKQMVPPIMGVLEKL
ncbi:MAG: putative manganese-dependent inorganic diphosphatase [Tenericutes bacterium]|nr:putative manganese-dependent inorganic diphosphatase [Mycoplasmatota bacterium]